jgi:hypothetical protein
MAVNPDAGWDLSIKDRNGQLVLVVEVKRKTNASPDWAAAFRRNILSHGIFYQASGLDGDAAGNNQTSTLGSLRA